MLRGAVTFGEDFEQNYMKQIFFLEKGMNPISHFSRFDDARVEVQDDKYQHQGNKKKDARTKLERFYDVSISILIVVAAILFIFTAHFDGPGQGSGRSSNTTLVRQHSMRNKRLLICNLDNTLYDWVGYFAPSFYAMVDEAVRITGCDRETLLDDFRRVHQARDDSEQPFALLETETIKQIYQDVPAPSVLDPAFHAFNSSRLSNVRLYPTVRWMCLLCPMFG
jgi:hypothetical protein